MSLITLLNAHIAFGERPLLDDAQLTVQAGERLGLIGRNGTGKSTLLGVLAGKNPLDDGQLQRREGLRLALVEQEPQLPSGETLQDSLLLRAKACALRSDGTPADEREHWRLESRLEEFLHRFGLTGVTSPASCSGGERKRAALALALALQPDLLLLDEPTNHLDIEAIERLEELLLKVPAAIVITHDRAFLDRVTTRIIELDRGILRSYPGSFAAYEQRKGPRSSQQRTPRGAVSRSSGSRKRSGYAKVSRPAERATKDACAVSSNCASSARRDATGSETFASLPIPVSAQAILWPSSMG
jgi:ATP-binding cassette subfamily F protein uup